MARQCCACGAPEKMEDGKFNMAVFPIEGFDIEPGGLLQGHNARICQECTRAAVASWAKKIKNELPPKAPTPPTNSPVGDTSPAELAAAAA